MLLMNMNRRNTIVIVVLLILLVSCKKNLERKTIQKENKQYKKKEKRIYYLNYSILGVEHADFFINDIKIKNGVGGSGYEELNPYILNSGECTIKIKMYYLDKTLRMVDPELLIPQDEHGTGGALRVRVYTSDENEENVEKLIEFKNRIIDTPVPLYEASWTFEAEVPYKLEGWGNAEDLTKIDKEKLEKKVVAKFKEYREMLSSGDVDSFYESQNFSFEEEVASMYINPKTQNEWKGDLHDIFKNQKDRMLPLENYKMRFYGDGKLVTLERTDLDEKLHGFCALISKYERTYHKSDKKYLGQDLHRVYLMLPKNETEFKIARYFNYIN